MAYTAATPADLKTRYPAFADVADETIQTWLDEGAFECSGWPEDWRARAEMAYAAHRLVESGALASNPASMLSSSGLTSFKSGTFSATVDGSVASRTGWETTVYGREFEAMLHRFFSGPMLAWTPPAADYAG